MKTRCRKGNRQVLPRRHRTRHDVALLLVSGFHEAAPAWYRTLTIAASAQHIDESAYRTLRKEERCNRCFVLASRSPAMGAWIAWLRRAAQASISARTDRARPTRIAAARTNDRFREAAVRHAAHCERPVTADQVDQAVAFTRGGQRPFATGALLQPHRTEADTRCLLAHLGKARCQYYSC